MMNNLGIKAVSNMLWKFLERISSQAINLAVTLFLARILSPSDYGVVSVVAIFIGVCNVFINQGFGSALIQKLDVDEKDFSSMFYASLVISAILYVTIFFAAPYISIYFGNSYLELCPALRVMGLQIIISAYKTIQDAYVSRNLIFKKAFYTTAFGTIISGMIGVFLAMKNYGVYALIGQSLSNVIINTLLMSLIVKWHPVLFFSFDRIKGMMGFSYRLVVSGVIERIYFELRSFVIGKKYSAAELAFYSQGNRIPSLIDDNVEATINAVLFPIMSSHQKEKKEIVLMCKRAVTICSYIMFPILMILALISEDLVILILTEKWQPCIIYVKIFCFLHLFYPIASTSLQAMKAVGDSKMYLKVDMAKKCIGLVILLITMSHGVLWIAKGFLIGAGLNLVVNMIGVKKSIGYAVKRQIGDIMPNVVIAFVAFSIVFTIHSLTPYRILNMFIISIIYSTIYISLSLITKNESCIYLLNLVKNKIHGNK